MLTLGKVEAIRTALSLEGCADLIHLWSHERNQEERNEIVADIQDLIEANTQQGKETAYVKFNELDKIAKNIRGFKDSLYEIVIKHGGVSKLAELTGIPQPSLSRFFNSNAMPRRATVLKIAKALGVAEIKIDHFWKK